MNPFYVLVPAAVVLLGQRIWVARVLARHDRDDGVSALVAEDFARALLDQHGLRLVDVEVTDLGDHYDPEARAVRLNRMRAQRRSLTAATTAAHEVAHAIQHEEGYAPFVWRRKLVRVAQVSGGVGTVLLFSVPLASSLARSKLPPFLVGSAAICLLSTGVVAQLVALPTELNASFARALPMLRGAGLAEEQLKDARGILLAGSTTYLASSVVSVLALWPWIGPLWAWRPTPVGLIAESGTAQDRPMAAAKTREQDKALKVPAALPSVRVAPSARARVVSRRRQRVGLRYGVRRVGKPLIRALMRAGLIDA